MTKDSGKIQVAMDKTTKKGQPFKSYNIGDEWFNCFDASLLNFNKGDPVTFEYEEKGEYKNILSMEKLPAIGSEERVGGGSTSAQTSVSVSPPYKIGEDVNPAFLGMCENQEGRYADLFKVLCVLNARLQKEING